MKERIEELRKEVEDFQITDADALEQFRINLPEQEGTDLRLF